VSSFIEPCDVLTGGPVGVDRFHVGKRLFPHEGGERFRIHGRRWPITLRRAWIEPRWLDGRGKTRGVVRGSTFEDLGFASARIGPSQQMAAGSRADTRKT